jgi:hypothetical protein
MKSTSGLLILKVRSPNLSTDISVNLLARIARLQKQQGCKYRAYNPADLLYKLPHTGGLYHRIIFVAATTILRLRRRQITGASNMLPLVQPDNDRTVIDGRLLQGSITVVRSGDKGLLLASYLHFS